ncbi:hypothetical protein GB931_00160 [Modestobacter sp. I12A-02628]|uniref:Uncharacterized protein n=1 Tax=Goekera deserti TaxID=2497753 RepID=A0A7K3WI35_9ACTN|nr:hypothetical protein [Goekera deserti]MPQ96360.1 hypothetical protein [Goekera deserti]NDI50528.1 hypothetical protein [Goekera deserti]NEL56158.1 hypothetical protein [Goekera deserti]
MDTLTQPAARITLPPSTSPVVPSGLPDPAQDFVMRLRAAAGGFAAAAGAQTAVVREAVPPARHRRSRCRVVLRFRDGTESDVTFLGSTGRTAPTVTSAFDAQIQLWLATGQDRDHRWVVADPEAADGTAVDVSAWMQYV